MSKPTSPPGSRFVMGLAHGFIVVCTLVSCAVVFGSWLRFMKLEKEIIKMEQKVDVITKNQGRNSSAHRGG